MYRFCIGVLAVFMSLAVAAEEPASEETVRELLELMDAHTLIDALIGEVQQIIDESTEHVLGNREISPEHREIMREANSQMAELMRREMRWEVMESDMIALYRKHFTQTELDAMIAFYRTEAGQSVMQKMPAVVHESIQLSHQRMQTLMPEISRIQQETFTKLDELSTQP